MEGGWGWTGRRQRDFLGTNTPYLDWGGNYMAVHIYQLLEEHTKDPCILPFSLISEKKKGKIKEIISLDTQASPTLEGRAPKVITVPLAPIPTARDGWEGGRLQRGADRGRGSRRAARGMRPELENGSFGFSLKPVSYRNKPFCVTPLLLCPLLTSSSHFQNEREARKKRRE